MTQNKFKIHQAVYTSSFHTMLSFFFYYWKEKKQSWCSKQPTDSFFFKLIDQIFKITQTSQVSELRWTKSQKPGLHAERRSRFQWEISRKTKGIVHHWYYHIVKTTLNTPQQQQRVQISAQFIAISPRSVDQLEPHTMFNFNRLPFHSNER